MEESIMKSMLKISCLSAAGIAALALVSCQKEMTPAATPEQPSAKTYTLTVDATKGNDTKALALDGHTLNVKWSDTDQVAVFPVGTNTRLLGTLTATASETGTTQLSGDLTGTVNVSDNLSLLFPRGEWDYTGQKGILLSDGNSIEKKYDYALADVTVESIDDSKITTTANADFSSQQAIVKFILKDKDNNNAINAKKLTISAASNKLLTRKTLANAGDRIYHSGYTVTSGSGGIDGDDKNNLVDGDLSTKWCANTGHQSGGVWYIEFNTASPIKVDGYMLRTANDTKKYPGRNPTSWVLKGKATSGGTWDTIDSKSGYDDMPETNFTERDFEEIASGTYQYFRLEISAVKDGTIMQLSEMKLFTDATEQTEINDYGPIVVTPASAASELTIALRNENAGADTYTITVTAADGETYKLEKSGVTFENGKYYEIMAKLTNQKTIDLSTLTANKTIQDGYTLTGTLANKVKISIAAGATVTLDNVTINGENSWSYSFAGINCEGDATIILKEGTTNTVKGFYLEYPGIYIAAGKTLTIEGTGSLNASSNGKGAGIGSGESKTCGNIVINGGNITATGKSSSAGIGSGYGGTCGTITINGGNITANSEYVGAGIGSGGEGASCGNITITGGTITARCDYDKGAGIGSGDSGTCGDITISGGNIKATASHGGAGIGSGDNGASCGNITIAKAVTRVEAKKGLGDTNYPNYSIGNGAKSTCGTVKFGDQTMYNGTNWTLTPTDGSTYGGLRISIYRTSSTNDTWTLTPAPAQ